MICPNCGCENKDTAKFCFRCGFKFTAYPPNPAVRQEYVSPPQPKSPEPFTPGFSQDAATRPLRSASLLFVESSRQFEMPPQPVTSIGRADRQSGYVPEIDLTEVDMGKVVSRKHACITYTCSGYKIKDMGSTNGTFLNNSRLQQGVEWDLKNGDEIIFGKVICIFSCI